MLAAQHAHPLAGAGEIEQEADDWVEKVVLTDNVEEYLRVTSWTADLGPCFNAQISLGEGIMLELAKQASGLKLLQWTKELPSASAGDPLGLSVCPKSS
jgi:hypothetical protein